MSFVEDAARRRGRAVVREEPSRRGNDSQALRRWQTTAGPTVSPRTRRRRNNDVNCVSLLNPVYLIEKSWVTLLPYFTQRFMGDVF